MPSKTYQRLIDDLPELMLTAFGRSGRRALGMRGSARQIELMYNLMSNYDGACRLHRLTPDLSFVSTTPARLHKAIRLFLYCNVLLSKEAGSFDTWDEDTGVYTLTQDTATAERLAVEGADAFLARILVKSFLPSDYSTPAHEYQAAA